MKRAAKSIIQGAAYDNNLLCIGEKEVFVLDKVADELMSQLEKAGAVRLNGTQLAQLTKEIFTFKEGHGGGCPEPILNKAYIGKDAAVLAKAAGLSVPE
jgi:aldehyde dehydrogenase